MDLSIIIPTLNYTGDQLQDKKVNTALQECIMSLRQTSDFHVTIASNSLDAKTIPIMDSAMSRINLWEQGQCKAVNAAVATTDTEWIMVSNDDMVYPPGWVDTLSEEYDCYSPVLVEPQDGAPTFIKKFFGGAGGDFDKAGFYQFVEDEAKIEGWKNGFNLPFVMKRELWDLIGGYDINYDPWGSNSDSDLEYKVKLAGHQPKQRINWFVYHFSQTSGTFHPSKQKFWDMNWNYFIDKWGFPRTDDKIWEAEFVIPYDKLKYKPKWAVLPDVEES